MFDSLRMIYDRLISSVRIKQHRFLYESFEIRGRLVGLVGPRGVGKTTMLLQYIRENHPEQQGVFYFSADHIYFRSHTLYEFVEYLYLHQSTRLVFIDEVHKYAEDWSQELKNLYDGFPDIKIVFSGSSSLDLVKGSYDLSRRAILYHLPGLSFREYLNFSLNLDLPSVDYVALTQQTHNLSRCLADIPGILGHFHDYLEHGYYPFFTEDKVSYFERVRAIIDKTIHEDIANFYSLKTSSLSKFGRILNYLSSIPPGKVSTYNLGKNLSVDDKTAASYLQILQETGLVQMIYPAEPGAQGLRRSAKVFLSNTNLYYAMLGVESGHIESGTIRELAFIQATINADLSVYHNKHADFEIQGDVFEIGGKNKTRAQLKGIPDGFIVRDDTLASGHQAIPLLYFGFLY